MPKIILEFSEDEIKEAVDAINVNDRIAAIQEFDNELRKVVKYGTSLINEKDASDLEIEITEKVREKLHQIFNSYNISID